ncbi:response regulator transcription factor [Kribbella antibiotica]|uniref:Response regulator transcription factor n=1 Tax=Kribbella antibiotica TaxID=190195 RepID=A0A4R4ZTK7_9ACTN|nr:response regulator transcription factor [Kribbella antibiotica]TDD60372.1 response regulator transcription factor [Kribbella antibiotica]
MRMLIVEDEQRLATSLALGLTVEGFTVDVSYDGPDGLLKATTGTYDLVMLDVNLPGMNGYRICAELRAAHNPVPILMLTAKDGDYDEAEGLDAGADDYLTKPFSYMVLIARIRALLRRQGRIVARVVRIGDLVIDRGARRVTRDGADVTLTAKEFCVLEQLVVRAGGIVSKTEILEHVWDLAYQGDANLVEVYVSALRRKLGAGLIETMRGAGYRLAGSE